MKLVFRERRKVVRSGRIAHYGSLKRFEMRTQPGKSHNWQLSAWPLLERDKLGAFAAKSCDFTPKTGP